MFDKEIKNIAKSNPKVLKSWWKEKISADKKFGATSAHSPYNRALSKAIKSETDNVTQELGKRSKDGKLFDLSTARSAVDDIPATPDIPQYTMNAGDEHIQRVDELLGLNSPQGKLGHNPGQNPRQLSNSDKTTYWSERSGPPAIASNKGLMQQSRGLMQNRGVSRVGSDKFDDYLYPMADGPVESLFRGGASDDVINMTRSTKPGAPPISGTPEFPGNLLNYDAGKYSDASGKLATMKIIKDGMQNAANRKVPDNRKYGPLLATLYGLAGDFTYGVKNNSPKIAARAIDATSKMAANSKLGNALLAQDYGNKEIPESIRAPEAAPPVEAQDLSGGYSVGDIETDDEGNQLRFLGGDINDEDNWEKVQ